MREIYYIPVLSLCALGFFIGLYLVSTDSSAKMVRLPVQSTRYGSAARHIHQGGDNNRSSSSLNLFFFTIVTNGTRLQLPSSPNRNSSPSWHEVNTVQSNTTSALKRIALKILSDHQVTVDINLLERMQQQVSAQRNIKLKHINKLKFIHRHKANTKPTALILLTPAGWLEEEFRGAYVPKHCAYTNCKYTTDRKKLHAARMIIYYHNLMSRNKMYTPKISIKSQVTVFATKESVKWYFKDSFPKEPYFNYSITYKSDADIPNDYGSLHWFEHFKPSIGLPVEVFNRSKIAYQYVSNCGPMERQKYNREMSKHVQVDTFGKCFGVPDGCKERLGYHHGFSDCQRRVMDSYKFYLAFENSRCKEYITEKFFRPLEEFNIPVVMGPPKAEYIKIAPPNSFIHVDDFKTPKDLADYLKEVASNRTLFMQYHLWRYTDFYPISYEKYMQCEICRLANEQPRNTYDIFNQWDSSKDCSN